MTELHPIDYFVLEALYARLTRQDSREALTPVRDVSSVSSRRDTLRTRRSGLASLVADGTMTAEDVREAAAALDAEIAELSREIDRATSPDATLTPEEIAQGLDALSLDRARALIDANMVVELHRGVQGRRGFDPASVTIRWR